MEPQAKTFMEHSGFMGSEIKSGEHDSALVSLMDSSLMRDVIFSLYPEVGEGLGYWASDFVIFDPETTHRIVEFPTWDIVNGEITPGDICEAFRREYPLSSIQSSDVEDQLSRLHLEVEEFRSLERPVIDITSVYPIVRGAGEAKSIIGYVDFFVRLTYMGTTHFSPFKNCRRCSYDFFVEVRKEIDCVGAVLREMRTYMEFTKARPVLITSVDPETKEKLESQGVPVFVWDF